MSPNESCDGRKQYHFVFFYFLCNFDGKQYLLEPGPEPGFAELWVCTASQELKHGKTRSVHRTPLLLHCAQSKVDTASNFLPACLILRCLVQQLLGALHGRGSVVPPGAPASPRALTATLYTKTFEFQYSLQGTNAHK